MDEFVSTVENQVIGLHPLDTQAAFLNIPYHFFFGNDNNAADFMPNDAIRLSFYRALKQFPILAGYLRPEGTGQTSVVIDKDDLNMPEYVESTSNTHYDTLRESHFHHSAWPKGLTRASAITMAGPAGRIRLANAHVVRLKDNSGVIIFINIPHYVVDGTGFFSFVELWGKHCLAERTGDGQLAQQASQLEYCFDRDIISRHLPAERKPLGNETMQAYTGFSPIADWLAWLSPNTRGRVLNKAKFSSGVVSHTFRVSRQALDSLRKEVGGFIADGSEDQLTDRYLLAAVLSKLIARAHLHRKQQDKANVSVAGWLLGAAWSALGVVAGLVGYGARLLCCSSSGNSSAKSDSGRYQSLNLLDDVRHGLGIVDKQYMGNGLLPHNTQCPLDVLEMPITPKSLAQAVDLIRPIYENADAALVASFVDLLTSNPKSFTRPMIYMAKNPELLVITCEMEFKLYASDFGDGPPEWVCTIPSFVANFIGLLPSPPPSTDVVANIILKAPVMKHVLKDEFWREFTQIIY
ncbi:hypothetical protein IWW57_000729 [Coemansia sp. S610]|nr:hypothetical protein IWW57_000729 [Coemansia sp. S610]